MARRFRIAATSTSRAALRFRSSILVITSYSIHYTKLYDVEQDIAGLGDAHELFVAATDVRVGLLGEPPEA